MMQNSPEVNHPTFWKRFFLWIIHYQAIVRLVSLTVILSLFLLVLPTYMRIVFWNNLQSHKFLASMLLIFGLLGISLVWSTGQRIDAWTFLLFNIRGTRPFWLDRVMFSFTQIGSGITALGIALVLFLVNQRMLSYKLILGTLSLWLTVELLKFLVHRSRPFIRLTQARIIGNRARGRSFPSGHTSQVFFMAALMAQQFRTHIWVVILLYGVAILVGITRMYVGAHYPRDVLAGAILGNAWGLIVRIIDGYAA